LYLDAGAPALGDINGDGRPDLVYADFNNWFSDVYVVHNASVAGTIAFDGTTLWNEQPPFYPYDPYNVILADLQSRNALDIFSFGLIGTPWINGTYRFGVDLSWYAYEGGVGRVNFGARQDFSAQDYFG